MSRDSQPPHDPNDALSPASSRLLSELTKDLKASRPPEIDFDRMERELFAKIDAEPARASTKRSRGAVVIAFTVLSAAAAAFLVLRSPKPAPIAPTAPTPVERVAEVLSSEDVTTNDAPRSFAHEGLAAWTLAPHSHAQIVQRADLVTVSLTDGAIDVDVIPQPVAERFVVLVGETRVAVHGTRFRVAKTTSGVDVDVAHGVVAVGPVNAVGEAPRWLLPGPVGGSFAANGTEGTLRPLRPFDGSQAPSAQEEVATPKPKPVVMKAPQVARPQPDSPSVSSLSPVALGARAQDEAASCFEKNARLAAGVHLTVATTLTLSADAQGILSSTFDPPLAPPVESCFRDAMAQVRAPAGSYEISLSLADRR